MIYAYITPLRPIPMVGQNRADIPLVVSWDRVEHVLTRSPGYGMDLV